MTAFERLALDGGTPRLTADPVAWWPQFTSDDDLVAIQAARRIGLHLEPSGRRALTGGPVATLERRWAAATGRTEAIACATVAVGAKLFAVGLELAPGDEVITLAGAAVAGPLASLGIVMVPVDVHPRTLQMDPAAVAAAVTVRTRAVIAVDLYGTTADYRALAAVTEGHDLVLVEDGSASIGASFDRRPVGSLGTTSLCSLPTETASGVVAAGTIYTTDDRRQGANARRSMLIDDPLGTTSADGDRTWAGPVADGSPLLGASSAGSSAMADVDADIALALLARLDDDVAIRSANGDHLRRALAPIPGIWMPEPVRGATHTYSSFPIIVVPDELGLPEAAAPALRDTIVDCMTAEGLWIEAARRRGEPDLGDRFPVLGEAHAGGIVLGRSRSPFVGPSGVEDMERIAGCFAKILLDNRDRVRQLTLERTAPTIPTVRSP
ncbi:MAG: DegT/DnrJ/EryC1/StrS family aminotransferase [Acidimicrobiia bacterium]|nr:DegT/DnrJ/EryC1/StrS family aminotransferase [Acidimicrobiia bacterium]